MRDIKLVECLLRRASVSFDDASSGSGEVRRENSFSIETLADAHGTLKVRDLIRADFSKGVGARFESEVEVRLQFEQPVTHDEMQEFAWKFLDGPALSMSNLAFAFLVSQMGFGPLILPPVWEEGLARHRKAKARKKAEAGQAVESGAR